MARIRSLHPGQPTDEDFVEMGPWARLFALHLRCEADDQGVFEWKPRKLKLTIFPADDVSVEDMLDELVEHRQIARFEVDGRPYGVIRNFAKWQSPKSPKPVHPLPDEWRAYAGFGEKRPGPGRPPKHVKPKETKGWSEKPNGTSPTHFGNDGENNSQREDGGGKREGETDVVVVRADARGGEPDDDEPDGAFVEVETPPFALDPEPNVVVPFPTPEERAGRDRVLAALREAAGDGVAWGLVGIEDLSPINDWIEQGADLERHILPVIRAGARRAAMRSDPISSWTYFARPVAKAVAAGRSVLPEVGDAGPPGSAFGRRRTTVDAGRDYLAAKLARKREALA